MFGKCVRTEGKSHTDINASRFLNIVWLGRILTKLTKVTGIRNKKVKSKSMFPLSALKNQLKIK